jgi:uncharacterized protein
VLRSPGGRGGHSPLPWYLPRDAFHDYLKRLVDAGFASRIMFGSDQMNWPDAIGGRSRPSKPRRS